jgi:hypothetical protein
MDMIFESQTILSTDYSIRWYWYAYDKYAANPVLENTMLFRLSSY